MGWLLGRLLSDLRRAAAPHAPMFTPETVQDDSADRHNDQETLLYEALAPRLRGMSDAQVTAALRNVSPRDAAKIIGRQGYRTYLQAHEAGATLGLRRLFTPASALNAGVATLPSALAARVRTVQGLTAALQRLPETEVLPPVAYDDEGDHWGPLVHPAFLVIAGLDAQHDPVSEALNEQWQLCCEYGDTAPFALLPFGSRADQRRAARALMYACKALRLVRLALETLGAVEL